MTATKATNIKIEPYVTQYKILAANFHEDISKDVTRHLQGGWSLHGELIIIEQRGTFYQAITK